MNKIISFVMVGTNDLEKSSKFYDAIFLHIGLKKITTTERYIGYGHIDAPKDVKFYITKPHDKKTDFLLFRMKLLIIQVRTRINSPINNSLTIYYYNLVHSKFTYTKCNTLTTEC